MIYSFNYFTGGFDEFAYKGSEQCDGHGGGWRLQPWDFKNQFPKPITKPAEKEVSEVREENPTWINVPDDVQVVPQYYTGEIVWVTGSSTES